MMLVVVVKRIRSEPWSPSEPALGLPPHQELLELAEGNDPDAWFRLGLSFLSDRPDSPTDFVKAYYWVSRAASTESGKDIYTETSIHLDGFLTREQRTLAEEMSH